MKGRKPNTADIIDLMRRASQSEATAQSGSRGTKAGARSARAVLPVPGTLNPAQRRTWRFIVGHAPEGTFAPEDSIQLERLVKQVWIAALAEADVEANGITVTDRFGEAGRNPSLVTLHQAVSQIARLSAELGVGSVIARAKALARQQQDGSDDD